MAKRYRKSRTVSQRQYRARLAKYEKYLAKTDSLEPKSFKEWNAPYRYKQFMKKEYKLYKEKFKKREESARYGFRLTSTGQKVEAYKDLEKFINAYELKRNTLVEEVEMGERERVGSVITELINDQAYELSDPKARGVADYLIREERQMLIEKGLVIPTGEFDENGKEIDIVKKRNLKLLIRQGQFVREEVGLWDEIKDVYKYLTGEGMTSYEAKKTIGQQYFNSN